MFPGSTPKRRARSCSTKIEPERLKLLFVCFLSFKQVAKHGWARTSGLQKNAEMPLKRFVQLLHLQPVEQPVPDL